MRNPRNLFLFSGAVCFFYMIYRLVQGDEITGTFWVAAITLFVCAGAWYSDKSKEES